MKKLAFYLLATFLFSIQIYAQWEECNNGLYGGYIRAIANDGNNIFVTTWRDGVYLSTDFGKSWVQKNNGIANAWQLYISAITISDNKIFIGTASQGFYISTDYGDTWIQKNNGFMYPQVYSIIIKGSNTFVATSYGVYLSTDDGDSWEEKNNGLINGSAPEIVMVLKMVGNNIFAGTVLGGVYESTNNGDSWISKNNGSGGNISTIVTDGNNVFIGTRDDNNKGIFLSTNNGDTWTNKGLVEYNILSIAISNNIIYAGSGSNGIFISTDYGNSWISKNNGLTNTNINTLFVIGNNILTGTEGNGVFLSTNNGDSWRSFGIPNQEATAIAINDNNIITGTWYNYIFHSTDNGDTWTAKNNGITDVQRFSALAISGNTIYGAADDMLLSTNMGDSWTTISLSNSLVFALAMNGDDVFAGTRSGGIFLSTDHGKNWIPKNNGLGNLDIYSIAVNGNNVYAGTTGGIYVSTDYGSNWQKKNNILSSLLIYSLSINGNILYAGVHEGLFKSTDNGATFVKKGLDGFEPRSIIITGNNIIAGTYYAGVFISTDSGNSWFEDNTGLINQYVRAVAVSKNTIFACTDGNGVFRKGGYQFVPLSIIKLSDVIKPQDKNFELNLPITVFNPITLQFSISSDNIELLPSDSIKVVNSDTIQTMIFSPIKGKTGEANITINVSDGVDSVSTTFKVTVVKASDVDDLESNNIFAVNPNPAYSLIDVVYNLQFAGSVQIVITNSYGQQVYNSNVNYVTPSDGQKLSFDISSFPSGLYFITLRSSAITVTKGVLVVK